MYNAKVIAKVVDFNTGRPNKNGEKPVLLRPVYGKFPNRFVVDRTVATNEGFEVGKTYLTTCQETESSDEYGRQFQWRNEGEIKPLDLAINAEAFEKAFGQPEVFSVDAEVVETAEDEFQDEDLDEVFTADEATDAETEGMV